MECRVGQRTGTACSHRRSTPSSRLLAHFVQWQRQRRDILELQRMDDRLLADIGITRGEAEHMVRNGRWSQASFEPDAAFPATDRKRSSVLIWDKELGERA